jgi:hypothetical protein
MPVTPGARLGPYEILSALGAGGMGEVDCSGPAAIDDGRNLVGETAGRGGTAGAKLGHQNALSVSGDGNGKAGIVARQSGRVASQREERLRDACVE